MYDDYDDIAELEAYAYDQGWYDTMERCVIWKRYREDYAYKWGVDAADEYLYYKHKATHEWYDTWAA